MDINSKNSCASCDVGSQIAPDSPQGISLVINEAQLLLAEKRTALAVMRTGIAIFALPLSVLSVLIATSRYYDALQVMHFLFPLLGINVGLISLGVYLIARALKRIRAIDHAISDLKSKCPNLRHLIT